MIIFVRKKQWEDILRRLTDCENTLADRAAHRSRWRKRFKACVSVANFTVSKGIIAACAIASCAIAYVALHPSIHV